MKIQTDITKSTVDTAPPQRPNNLIGKVIDYIELTKPGVVWLILMSTGASFYLASHGTINFPLFFHAVMGTALVAGGTGSLNQYIERDLDFRMRRTANRPLPSGRLKPRNALLYGISLSALGIFELAFFVNFLSSFLALITLFSYLLFYTPLKKKTTYCTLVGAFPGAMPPAIGWTAARGQIELEAITLYAILFLWQFPHFLAIALMYKNDYARAGIVMLPVVDKDGKSTQRQIKYYTCLLLAVSLVPAFIGLAGNIYLVGSLLLGLSFAYYAFSSNISQSIAEARQLLLASVFYLPLLYALLVAERFI